MPRNPRKRGKGKNDKKKRGISKEQVCIETAIDRKGNILMGAVCNGRITTNQISLWVLFVMVELQQIK